jgi:hypothetical protein
VEVEPPKKITSEEVFPELNLGAQEDYYTRHLWNTVGYDSVPTHILHELFGYLIGQGYRIGEKVDVLSEGQWHIAEIKEIRPTSVQVHYIGWSKRWDEWINVPSNRISAAFRHRIPPEQLPANTAQVHPKFIEKVLESFINDAELGFEAKEAVEAFRNCGYRKAEALYELMYKRFGNP